MSIPHPIPYQGSKRILASSIIAYFPADAKRLIEPFAGSAAVTLAAMHHHKVEQVLLNDINTPLMELWRSIISRPDMLADYYEKLWLAQSGRERQFYDLVRCRFNKNHRPYYFLYLLARCVKAAVRYNAQGEFNQSPDNRRKGRQPHSMRRDIHNASALLKSKAQLTTTDYREIVQEANPEDIIYMDPPYQGVCDSRDPRYIQGIVYDDFVATLESLNNNQISYIVSYDGRTGDKKFGRLLPPDLTLTCIELNAGRSTQSTLLGRRNTTYESLYLSPALVSRLDRLLFETKPEQLLLFGG